MGRPAIGFAAPLKGRVIAVLVHHRIRASPQLTNCFDLLFRKAVRRHLRAFAQEVGGIEMTASGIIQDPIHHPIKGVARCVDRIS